MSFLSFRYEDHSNLFSEECFKARVKENIDYLEKVQEGEEKYASFLGWHRVDEWAGEEWLKRYESLAGEIRKECDTLVVIGVGGSNQAARAVYEALGKKDIEIIWAGNTLSAHSVNKLFEKLEEKKNIYINCIAKNFETLEPGIAFRALRCYLQKKYGEYYNSHIIVTFTENTYSWKMAEE